MASSSPSTGATPSKYNHYAFRVGSQELCSVCTFKKPLFVPSREAQLLPHGETIESPVRSCKMCRHWG